MRQRSEAKGRQLVVTLWELVEAAANVIDDDAEAAAVVEHVLRTRGHATLGMAGESGPAHHGGAPRERPRDALDGHR